MFLQKFLLNGQTASGLTGCVIEGGYLNRTKRGPMVPESSGRVRPGMLNRHNCISEYDYTTAGTLKCLLCLTP